MFWIFFSSTIGAAILIIVLIYYFAAGIGELRFAKKEWEVLGLKDGFVPQGLTYSKEINKFLMSGYMIGSRSSRVYVIDGETRQVEKFVIFENLNGSIFKGHAGGIASSGMHAFISSEGKVLRFSLKKLQVATGGEKIKFDYEKKTENGADFCFVHNGLLWVGEFYKIGKFETDVNHHILTDSGKNQKAVMFGFRLSENSALSTVPEKAISIPDMVQGMTFCKGKIFASFSYGMSKSKICEYDNLLVKKTSKFIGFNDRRIPLWVLDEKFLRKTKILPPMCEELVFAFDRIFVVFESASKKYKYFMRTRLKNVYSLKVD